MPPRHWPDRVRDILEAIRRIEEYTSGVDQRAFEQNTLLVDAVVRNLAVIGEAARHVPDEIQDRHSDVPWIEMRRLRNFVVHEYFGVSVAMIFTTIRDDLPILRERLLRLDDSAPGLS